MNSLQKVQKEILEEFIEVCDKLNLTYFLVCGSALGSVKYKGFIPWDDDIDVAMPRDDYEIFINKAQMYLPSHYFIQTYLTDSNFPQIYCKIRNSQTTYIEKTAKYLDINHGIFIDVFPLDGYPINKVEIFVLETVKKICQTAILSCYDIENKSLWIKVCQFLKFNKNINRWVALYTNIISKYKIRDSLLICNHGNWQGKLEYSPKWHYGKGKQEVFEGVIVRVPECYDAYLTQKYGEWRKDLPLEEQVGHHYCETYDVENSYVFHLKK